MKNPLSKMIKHLEQDFIKYKTLNLAKDISFNIIDLSAVDTGLFVSNWLVSHDSTNNLQDNVKTGNRRSNQRISANKSLAKKRVLININRYYKLKMAKDIYIINSVHYAVQANMRTDAVRLGLEKAMK